MGRSSHSTLRTALVVIGSLGLSTSAWAQSIGDMIPDSYICIFRPGPVTVTFEAHSSVAKVGGQVTHVYQNAVHGFSAHMSAAAEAELVAHNPMINYCEEDRIAGIPDGDNTIAVGKPGGGGGGGSTQTVPWGITRLHGPGDGTGKTAWVIDSGIDTTHPDLNFDASRSKSFLTNDTSVNDANGHGTHVAGIIAAKNNLIGVVGVAANASVVALRVLDRRGNGPDSGVIAAIDYAAADGADRAQPGDVANLSLITTFSQAMNDAVAALGSRGVFVAIAAGNNAADASNYSPASASGPNVFTVSAFQQVDTWASFSNFGPPVDFSEPGVSIYSTYKGGGYATLSGTSMAAPHLAGLLLLNGTSVVTNGLVQGDPDASDDPIAVLK
jgi:subtilisin family serine protease